MIFLLTFWSYFKHIGSLLIDFFNTKAGQYVLFFIIITVSLYFLYNKGYNNGVDYQKELYNIELNKALKEQATKQEEEYKKALSIVEKEVVIEKVYIDKIKIVEKIVNNNPKIKNKECQISEKDLKEFNKSLDEIK